MFDVLFRGARVLDGTGNPWFHSDVGIEGDRITQVGDLSSTMARRTVQLDDRVLAPGFIDLHTHSDFTLLMFPRAEAMIRQGVTTQVGGNCGFSPFPVQRDRLDLLRQYVAFLDPGLSWEWETMSGYAACLERLPLACNIALQVGHGTVRIAVMGFDDREPSASEIATMKRLVAEAMEEGALGLSSGLTYAPGSYSKTEELVALAEVIHPYGGFYSSHVRGEADTLLDAVNEALTIGRLAKVPVQLSHHKAADKQNWGRVEMSLGMIDNARSSGQDVLADQYPYTAGSTTLAAILPQWAIQGGITGMVARLADPGTRARIRAEILEPSHSDMSQAVARKFDLETIMIAGVSIAANKWCEGLMLTEIAAQRGEAPVDSALHLLETECGGAQVISFCISEDDVRRVMRHPAVAVASDGWVLSPEVGGKPHPRSYGTFARVLGKYVRDDGVLSLEEAVRKMTSLPAQRLGRFNLGLIRPGCKADLVVFDAQRVTDRATFTEPHRYCDGVFHVIVNGHFVIDEGQDTGARAGHILRRGHR